MLIYGDMQASQQLLGELNQLASLDWPAKHRQDFMTLRQTATDPLFHGAILPYFDKDKHRTTYYAVSDTGEEWRRLVPLLSACIGKTLTDFTGQVKSQPTSDSVIMALIQRGFFAVVPFYVYQPRLHGETVLQKLLQLYQILQEKKRHLSRTMPHSPTQVLFEFRMALSVGDRQLAASAIGYLANSMRIDALNRYFLQVQYHANFQEWSALYKQPFFHDLCLIRRPPAVTAALAETLYHTHVELAEQNDDPVAALDLFRRHVLPNSGTLFTLCPTRLSPAAAKAFLLAALAADIPDQHTRDRLRDIAAQWEIADPFFSHLMDMAASNQTITATGLASPESMYWHQVALARDNRIPASFDHARGLIFAALALQQLDVFALAYDYLRRLTSADQERIKQIPYLQRAWEEITQELGGERIPHSWREWVMLLPEMAATQAAVIAERAAVEWPISDYLHGDELKQLLQAFNTVPVDYQDQLLAALPAFVRWIQNDVHWPNPRYQPLYIHLFNYLLISEDRSVAIHQAISQIFEGIIAIGPKPAIYTQMLHDLGETLGSRAGGKSIDWLIDLAELTVAYPCADDNARLIFVSRIMQEVAQFGPRLTAIQRSVLKEIVQILGVAELLDRLPQGKETTSTAKIHLPKRYTIGIYTLIEQVGRAVVQHLERMYPAIQVKVNTDKVSSPQLKELAQHADLMVVCWATAKHAATIAIGQERPKEKATIFPVGSGTSSVLREITEYLSQL
jgi:hypothetical protein